MRLHEQRMQRNCGRFFGSLVALSAGLASIDLYNGGWAMALGLLPGIVVFSGLAWWAHCRASLDAGFEPGQGPGASTAGRPVPVGPGPGGHLVAAKGLPPSDKTYLFPRD